MATSYTNTELFLANTTNNAGTINLPVASSIPGRVLEFKDSNGTFNTKVLTLICNGSDKFEDGSSTKVLNTKFGNLQLVASGSKWYILNGTQVNTFQVSTLTTQSISTFLTNTSSINVSSLGFIDNVNSTNTLYTSTSFLLYNNFIISGTRVGYSNILNKFSFTPYFISSLTFWLDSSDSSTLFQDINATIPITTSGQSVKCWKDKVNNALAINNTSPPSITFSALNNKPVVNFSSASSQFLSLIATPFSTYNSSISFFVVSSQSTIPTSATAGIFAYGNTSGSYFQTGFVANYSGNGLAIIFNNQYGGNNVVPTNGTLNNFTVSELIASTALPTNATGYRDGTIYGIQNAGWSFNIPTGSTAYIGTYYNYNAFNYLNGNIAEIIFFTRALTTRERYMMEGYLAWKWGLQGNLPSNHPYKNAPP